MIFRSHIIQGDNDTHPEDLNWVKCSIQVVEITSLPRLLFLPIVVAIDNPIEEIFGCGMRNKAKVDFIIIIYIHLSMQSF